MSTSYYLEVGFDWNANSVASTEEEATPYYPLQAGLWNHSSKEAAFYSFKNKDTLKIRVYDITPNGSDTCSAECATSQADVDSGDSINVFSDSLPDQDGSAALQYDTIKTASAFDEKDYPCWELVWGGTTDPAFEFEVDDDTTVEFSLAVKVTASNDVTKRYVVDPEMWVEGG